MIFVAAIVAALIGLAVGYFLGRVALRRKVERALDEFRSEVDAL